MQMKDALGLFGLNEKQAAVYTSLLQLGQGTAYAVAEKSGLKRPTVYVLLEELEKKGAVMKIPRAGKRMFTAKSPELLYQEIADRTAEAGKVLPQLMAMVSSEKKPRVLYFEGLDGIKRAFTDNMERLRGKEIVGYYAHTENASNELMIFFAEYNDKMKELGITVRGIAPVSPTLKTFRKNDAEYNRVIKQIPASEYSASISIDIADAFVRMLAMRDMQAIVIENKDIAESMKQVFEMLWSKLGE